MILLYNKKQPKRQNISSSCEQPVWSSSVGFTELRKTILGEETAWLGVCKSADPGYYSARPVERKLFSFKSRSASI